jgi:hypothetical protein
MSDGARDALAGYLYQIFAAAGIGARAHGGLDDADHLTCDLVLLARQARILHEAHGEDVVFQQPGPANEATAVQVKFSRRAGSTPIQPADLRDILHAFDRARAAAAPALDVTGFILVSNRQLSASAEALYQKRDRPTPFAKLREPERNWLMIPTRKAREVKQQYGSTQAAAEAWHAIFRRLRIFAGVAGQHWLDGLRRYAVARGLPPEEFEGCLSRLVGEAVRGTIQHPLDLSRAWLNQTLLGFPDARPLTLQAAGDSAREAARLRAEQWYAENLVTKARTVIRRPLFAAVAQQAAQFPVVLLLGDGGCGKSVLAGRFVCEEGARRLVASVSTRDFDRHWLGESFNEWRSAQRADSLAVLPVSEVLRRVQLANEQEERPLLLLNVDGLDEATDEDRRELRRLLDACRTQQPPSPYAVVLLLTARLSDPSPERTRDHLIRLLTSAHYPAELAPQFGVVSVRDFDDDELREAIAALPPPLRGRLAEAIRILSGQASATTTLGEEAGLPPTRPVFDPGLLASLHHPALWGEFLDLDPEVQGRVLDGQREAVHDLACRFLERFISKVLLRRPTWPGDGVREALARIGGGFPVGEQRGRSSQHWVHPATGPLRQLEARDLFREAVSYGMILTDEEDWWRWRHGFVLQYLRSLEAG